MAELVEATIIGFSNNGRFDASMLRQAQQPQAQRPLQQANTMILSKKAFQNLLQKNTGQVKIDFRRLYSGQQSIINIISLLYRIHEVYNISYITF